MGLSKTITLTILTGVVIIAFINFGILLAYGNEPTRAITSDPSIANFTNDINDGLVEVYSDSSEAQDTLVNSSVSSSGVSGLSLTTFATLWQLLISTPTILYNILVLFISNNLFTGQGATVGGVALITGTGILALLGTLFIVKIIFDVWEAVQTGNPNS